MPTPEWPDLELLLLDRLMPVLKASLDPDGARDLHGGTDTPALDGRWFLKLRVVSGSDDDVTETSRVDVETFAPTRAEASAFGLAARYEMEALAGTGRPDGSGLIDSVETIQRPVWVNYSTPITHCFVGSYMVAVRRQ